MKVQWRTALMLAVVLMFAGSVQADIFGTGENQFSIDFVPMSGDAGDLGSWPAVNGYTFTGANRDDYRMGTFEITNDQWNKFMEAYGAVTGGPSSAYDQAPAFPGTNVPTNRVSWYEAAQFVNWLNTSTGHQAAYNFTGTQGTPGYTLSTWTTAEADNGTNFYRHKDAMYYMPTEDEWVKAAYWNGTGLQTYATKLGDTLHQGDGVSGTGWNYWDSGYATDPIGPWDAGSGSEELNGTFDMMGNIWEWMENPHWDPADYGTGSERALRGGSFYYVFDDYLASFARTSTPPNKEFIDTGFRVASEVPEPSSLALLSFGGLALLFRRR